MIEVLLTIQVIFRIVMTNVNIHLYNRYWMCMIHVWCLKSLVTNFKGFHFL